MLRQSIVRATFAASGAALTVQGVFILITAI
jgi:hypothetical protein